MALGNMPMVIVAHSMGGLAVRDALNRQSGREGETKVIGLVTIARRDVDPSSDFVHRLRRQKLPANLQYHLIYAFGNEKPVKRSENSDGVVPLSSQLSDMHQRLHPQCTESYLCL